MAITVSQATIDAIKKKGMAQSLKDSSAGGASDEFREGVRRMYGTSRQSASNEKAMNSADKEASSKNDTGNITAVAKSVPMPKSAPAAATRKAPDAGPKKIDTAVAGGLFKGVGKWLTSGDKKAAAEEKARTASKPPAKPGPAYKTNPDYLAAVAKAKKSPSNKGSYMDIEDLKKKYSKMK